MVLFSHQPVAPPTACSIHLTTQPSRSASQHCFNSFSCPLSSCSRASFIHFMLLLVTDYRI